MAKTKIVANYLRKAINEDGNLEVTFEVSNYHYKRYCQDLQKKPYTLEIAEVKNKRKMCIRDRCKRHLLYRCTNGQVFFYEQHYLNCII